MTDSICNYVPEKSYGGIQTVHFVYEAEFHQLKQPFMHSIYYMFLVTSGTATICAGDACHKVERGSIYLISPAIFYTVRASEDFRYMYVSFTGEHAAELLQKSAIDTPTCVFHGYTKLIDFWFSSIVRVFPQNANLVAESVLFHTLSHLLPQTDDTEKQQNGEVLCKMLVDYIDAHFTDPALSLGSVAKVFAYSEKYLSAVFIKYMKVGFSSYLGALRLSHACALLAEKGASVTAVAAACGYHDALYFSKVFKSKHGISPAEYMKRARNVAP